MLVAKITLADGSDGGILVPAGAALPEETATETASRIAKKDAPPGSSFVLVDAATLVEAAPTVAQLVAYANAKQVTLRDGGITVNVGSASTPDLVNVASDANGRTLVTGCVQLIGVASQASQPAPTFQWINNDGTQLTLTSTQMMAIGLKLGSFVQATYAALGTVLAAIANGSVTTLSAIDAAAWPTTSL